MLRCLPLYIIAALLAAHSALGDVVERRGMEPAVEGRISVVDDAGVTVSTELMAVHFIPWDRVRRVHTDLADPRLGRYLETAEDLWRARSRVERRDYQLAEPLLERLFEQYRGRTHETALVVAEGLLRCRLDRGANAYAVVPALEAARIRRSGVRTDSFSMLPEAIDEATSLCPALPPIWVPGRQVQKLARDLAEYDAQGDEIVACLAGHYRCAALRQTKAGEDEAADADQPDHPGAELLGLLVDCTASDRSIRLSASERLTRVTAAAGEWTEAWIRFHVGLARLGDPDIAQRERGMVSLLHLPARFSAAQPYLAGLALALVAETLEEEGEGEAAARLRTEMAARHPGHSVHHAIADGLRIRSIIATDEENP